MSKVLFLCDVDGVIAPHPYIDVWQGDGKPTELDYAFRTNFKLERQEANPETHFVPDSEATVDFAIRDFTGVLKTRPLRILYSAEMIAQFKKIALSPLVDFRWCSMWNENTQLLNELFGLGDIPYLPVRRSGDDPDVNKMWAVKDAVAAGQDFVWVDDEAAYRFVSYPYSNSSSFFEDSGLQLIIQPQTLWGFSRDELQFVDQFISDPAAALKTLPVPVEDDPIEYDDNF